jgi:hypothetical protein
MPLSCVSNWRIAARNPVDLISQFGSLGIRVPARTEPKDQLAEEMYCIRRYLFSLADNGLLPFPLTVIKQETPDFILSLPPNLTVGLEVTKATRPEFEADLTQFARTGKTRHYPSNSAAGAIHLSIAGWVGGAAEKEWAQYILASVFNKLKDIEAYGCDVAELLVYDNVPTAATDLNIAAEAVKSGLSSTCFVSATGRTFDTISVVRDGCLIYDIGRACYTLSYKHEWIFPRLKTGGSTLFLPLPYFRGTTCPATVWRSRPRVT